MSLGGVAMRRTSWVARNMTPDTTTAHHGTPVGLSVPREPSRSSKSGPFAFISITSGGFGPSLNGPMAMGYVAPDAGELFVKDGEVFASFSSDPVGMAKGDTVTMTVNK